MKIYNSVKLKNYKKSLLKNWEREREGVSLVRGRELEVYNRERKYIELTNKSIIRDYEM